MQHRHTQRLRPLIRGLLLAPAVAGLAACGSDSSADGDAFVIDELPRALVSTNAFGPDGSGAHALVEIEAPYVTLDGLDPTAPDIVATSNNGNIFKINRFEQDMVTKYAGEAPATPVWRYSTLDADEQGSSNAYDLIFAAPDKAYLLRYGQSDAWTVDPSVGPGQEARFKTGELDLSAYAVDNGDGSTSVPNMARGIIVDGKLFIAMQRFDDNFSAQQAFVAVFDVATDTEIDTTPDIADDLNGIALPIRNPFASTGAEFLYSESLNRLFVIGPGTSTFDADFNSTPNYDGGLLAIDPDTFETTVLIDDSEATGQLADAVLVNDTTGYLISQTGGFGSNTLYRFNPTTGALATGETDQPTAIAGLENTNLASIAVDLGQRLWIGRSDASNPGLTIVDTTDETITQALIPLQRNPARIEFTD